MVNAIADGMFHPSMKEKMTALEATKAALTSRLRDAPDTAPVLLHPGLAERYQTRVGNLTSALSDSRTQAEATSIIRGLLTEIRLVPVDGALAIELVGELAGLLALGEAQNDDSRPKAAGSTVLVAGVGFEPTTFRL